MPPFVAALELLKQIAHATKERAGGGWPTPYLKRCCTNNTWVRSPSTSQAFVFPGFFGIVNFMFHDYAQSERGRNPSRVRRMTVLIRRGKCPGRRIALLAIHQNRADHACEADRGKPRLALFEPEVKVPLVASGTVHRIAGLNCRRHPACGAAPAGK